MIYISEYSSPVGKITVAAEGENIIGLWIEGQRFFSDKIAGKPVTVGKTPAILAAENWLDSYFAGEKPEITPLKLRPEGTAFQTEVWKILAEIPYGKTVSYGEIAKRIAEKRGIAKMSARAVGSAVGKNPISVIIPCHRVIGSDGSLTGYSGGIATKIRLLEHEGAKYKKP